MIMNLKFSTRELEAFQGPTQTSLTNQALSELDLC